MDDLTTQAAPFRALPDEAPLAMPTQSLREAPPPSPRPASSPRAMALRRFVVIGGAIVLTIAGVEEMYRVFAVNGLTALAVFMLALFLALFAWIALSFTSALAGFFSLLAGGGRALGTGPDAPLPRLATRTALLMPTYNEQPSRIMAELQAIDESLREIGAGDAFDLFILSDTTDPDIWIAEEAGFLALRERTGGHGRIFYRRRPRNTARKSGNIAEWVRRFGGAYQQFLILDADSLMTGETLVRLVGAMERHPDVGLIQTLPIITGATTLFARMQQFAGRVYGPLIAHGIAWWHGAEGNYWGHNALIRTRAFAECAGLPELSGSKPFGGPIMSHDFVEAALMRRGGWAVHMVPGVRGSYEEVPPTLTDLAVRDRRWCQGNLQHAAVLPTRGLYAISRLHLLTGIGSYITAPLWLLFILTGILIAVQARFVQPDYFPAGQVAVPAVAGDRSGPRDVDVRRHDGAAAGAEAARLRGDPAAPERAARLRRHAAAVSRAAARDARRRADGAGGHADPVDRRGGDPARARFGLERAAARRRRDSRARNAATVPAAHGAWPAARGGCVACLVVSGAVDAAGGAGTGAGDPAGTADRPAVVRRRPVTHARGTGAATCGRTRRRVATRMAVGDPARRGGAVARSPVAAGPHRDVAARRVVRVWTRSMARSPWGARSWRRQRRWRAPLPL